MKTFVALTGELAGEGTRLPKDEETGEGPRLPKDETEARALAELQALARRLPEIRVVLSCSRAPDGVVNALPTVVDIPCLGEFHEANAGVWCSQEGRQLPSWFALLLAQLDLSVLKRKVVAAHVLQGSSEKSRTASPRVSMHSGMLDGVPASRYRLFYEIAPDPVVEDEKLLLEMDATGFVGAIEAIPGLSIVCSTAPSRSQDGVWEVSCADRRGLFYLQAVALVFDRLTPGRALYKTGDDKCSVIIRRNEPPLLVLEALGWIAKNPHLAPNLIASSDAPLWLNRMLSERLAVTEIEGLNATLSRPLKNLVTPPVGG